MAAPVLKFKRGAFANLPGLRVGEPGFTTDKYDLYVGLTSETSTNKFFGSHRYWGREDGTTSLRFKLVDKDGINSINLKSPNTLAGIVTYQLPGAQGPVNSVLTNDGSGNLSWGSGSQNAVFTGITTINGTFLDVNVNADFSGITTISQLTIGTGVAATQFSNSVSTGNSVSSVPTSSAIINYVSSQIGTMDLTLGINADTGGPSTVDTSQTLTIAGTTNEVETSVSGQIITVGLPNSVIVGTSLSAPTIKTATVQHSNGTQAATIDASGNITASQNFTITGNLYVNGSTTQVNTETLTVEDRLIEAGKVQTSPPSDSTWDVGVLFNYYKSNVNKRAGVFWDDSVGRIGIASETSVTNDSGTGSGDPLISVSTWAPIEIGALWVNDCAGQSQVISCTGTERFLENITVDAGTF
jgi:hypothetical protein